MGRAASLNFNLAVTCMGDLNRLKYMHNASPSLSILAKIEIRLLVLEN